MNKALTGALIILLGCSLSSVVSATEVKEEKIVHYRQGVYSVIGWNFGPMVGMVKGEAPFDGAVFEEKARRVKELSVMALEGFKTKAMTEDSEAKESIWENWDDFVAKMDEMNNQVAKLYEVSKQRDLEAIRAMFGDVGGSCKSCHDDYKEE